MTWLTSSGVLGAQAVIFLTLVIGIIYLQAQLRKALRQTAADRAEAIAEVRRTADDLMLKTSAIAEQLKRDTLSQTVTTAADLDAKMNEILTRFDAAGHQQTAVKVVVDDTNVMVHRELADSETPPKTTREQIDAIHEATEDTQELVRRKLTP